MIHLKRLICGLMPMSAGIGFLCAVGWVIRDHPMWAVYAVALGGIAFLLGLCYALGEEMIG